MACEGSAAIGKRLAAFLAGSEAFDPGRPLVVGFLDERYPEVAGSPELAFLFGRHDVHAISRARDIGQLDIDCALAAWAAERQLRFYLATWDGGSAALFVETLPTDVVAGSAYLSAFARFAEWNRARRQTIQISLEE